MASVEFKRLFEPGRIGNLVIRNRIVMPSLCDGMSTKEGYVTEQKIAYFAERARGGAGLINIGYAYVTRRGQGCTFYQFGNYEDGQIAMMRKLVDAIHAGGAKTGCQIVHVGRQTSRRFMAMQPEAASPIPCPVLQEVPEEMSVERIKEVVKAFGQAARRAKEAGFDLVEIHGAHGYLILNFMSPRSNHRTDQYGGSLENRMRFALEVIASIREQVGSDYPLGYRISGDEFVDGGLTLKDTKEIARRLEAAGIDYIHVSGGVYDQRSLMMMVGPMGVLGQLEHLAAGIKQSVDRIPVITVGRIKDPAQAEAILERGSADFVAMGRALIADPDLPNKASQGKLEDIRPCIGCNQGCLDRWFAALDVSCLGNPAAGREYIPGWAPLIPAARHKKVLVVGGGPGGLEAARVASLRGHDVAIWEKSSALGGRATLASKPSGREEFGEITKWLVDQVTKQRVEISLGKEATVDGINGSGADVVIVATGAAPDVPMDIPGLTSDRILTAFDVLAGQASVGQNVVVVGGDHVSCETALFLAEQGRKVTLVGTAKSEAVPDLKDEIARDMVGNQTRTILLDKMAQRLQIVTEKRIKMVTPKGVVLDRAGNYRPNVRDVRIGPVDEEMIPADTIVVAGRKAETSLFEALRGAVPELYAIGDCVKPRSTLYAIQEGAEVARAL